MIKEIRSNSSYIYRHLADEESRYVFANRLLYSLTGDYSYILHIVKKQKEWDWLISRLESCRKCYDSSEIWIFGAGFWGNVIYDLLSGIYPVAGFVDNDEKKHTSEGRVIRGLDTGSEGIYIIATMYYEEIEKQLFLAGVAPECMISVGRIWRRGFSRRQYFDPEFMKSEGEEIFIDCGCYDGMDVDKFAAWCGGNYKRILAFEPDIRSYQKTRERLVSRYRNTEVINGAVGEYRGEARFQSDIRPGCSHIDPAGGEHIVQVYPIDEVLEGEKATFIKMDIEGSELSALRGGSGTIRKYRPKLAICTYHKPEDMWEIPEYVLSLCEDYRLYFRHYNYSGSGTVMYAL